MLLATLMQMFRSPGRSYVWRPSLTLNDPQIVSALMPDNVR